MNDFSFGFDPYNPDSNSFGDEPNSDAYSGNYIPSESDCRSCGMCVNTCPTYRATHKEEYSPRGRVRLIDRLINDGKPLEINEIKALQACTLCRTCEQLCPSKMAYAELYDQASEKLSEQNPPSHSFTLRMLLHHFSTNRQLQKISSALVPLYQRLGLQWMIRALPFPLLRGEFKQLDKLLPENHSAKKIPHHSPTLRPECSGKVALFAGCPSNAFDSQTHLDTIKLLTYLGYDVTVPKRQTCCGAMHAHNGEKARAKELAKQNIEVFTEAKANTVIFNASGCGAFMSEYTSLLELEQTQPMHPITDILSFLQQAEWPEAPFKPRAIKLAVHEPCSQRNHLKNQNALYQLLNRVTGAEVVELPGNNLCCGAGGTRMITHPELAEPIRDEKVKALIDSGAEILLSSNMACAMHLAAGVRKAGQKIEVVHPVQFLARQLM